MRESLKAGTFLPAFPAEGWGYLFVRLRSERGGGNEPPSRVAKIVALTPPFHGETKVNVASVSLLPPPSPLPFPPPPCRFFEGTQKTESLSLCNFLGRCEHGPSPSLHPSARSSTTSGLPPEKCVRDPSECTETKIDF